MTTVYHPKVSPPSGKDKDPKEKGFLNRPRAGGKTIWDWLNLLGILAIPLVVVGATLLFSIQQANLAQQQHENDQKIANQQHETDKQSALDQQEATILQTYIDNIQDLLLNHNLLGSKRNDAVAILARARTLTALQGLDPVRKGLLVKFIYEAQLIKILDSKNNQQGPIISLSGADLHNLDLSGADLSGTEFSGDDLSGADLSGDDLSSVNLYNADLHNVDLHNTSLSDADLSSVQNLTQQQLNQVSLCKDTILPQGLTCHQNQ